MGAPQRGGPFPILNARRDPARIHSDAALYIPYGESLLKYTGRCYQNYRNEELKRHQRKLFAPLMLRGETPADAAARRGECVRECMRPCVRDAAATELRGAVRRSAAQQRLPQSVTNEVTDLVMENQRDALYLFI